MVGTRISDMTPLAEMPENAIGPIIREGEVANYRVPIGEIVATMVAATTTAQETADEALEKANEALLPIPKPVHDVSADYTITVEDLNSLLRVDSATPTNIYVPMDLPVGFYCDVVQQGVGAVYILADVDATVYSLDGQNKITGQYGLARVIVESVESVNLSGDLDGTGSIGWILAARISSEGWTLEIDMASTRAAGTMDPTKLSLVVTSEGYAGSVLGTVTRNISVLKMLRRSYALQSESRVDITGDVVTLTCVLSEQVFNDDKDGGAGTSGTDPVLAVEAGWWDDDPRTAPPQSGIVVENNSTEDYPVVNAGWNIPPALLSSEFANTFPMECIGAGPFAKDGKLGIGGVTFTATGQTSAHVETSTITDITVSTFDTTQRTLPALCWEYNPSDAGFTQGEKVTKTFTAYPRVGDADAVLTSSGSFGNTNRPSPYVDVCDKSGTYGRLYAAWDPVAGNDATGVVSTVRATAVASPFATDQHALYETQTKSNTDYSRANLGNHVLVAAGSGGRPLTMLTSSPSAPDVVFTQADCGTAETWFTIDAEPGCFLTGDASLSNGALPSLSRIVAPCAPTATGAQHVIVNMADSTVAAKHLWVKDATLTGQSDASNNMFLNCGYVYHTGVSATNPGRFLIANGVTNGNIMLVRNTDIVNNTAVGAPIVVNGLYINGATGAPVGEQATGSSAYPSDGQVICNMAVYKLTGTGGAIGFTLTRSRGSALINVLIEGTAAGSIAGMGINRDGNINPTKNHYIYNLGLYGENNFRSNEGYEDATTMTASGWWGGTGQGKKMFCHKGCVYNEWNFKTDVFATNGNNIHTWNVGYHVNNSYNAFGADSQGQTVPAPGIHIGEAFNVGEFATGTAAMPALFVDWKANSSEGGLGDYTPAPASTLIGKMPADEWPCKFDLHGDLRNNDGTGALGPIEAA